MKSSKKLALQQLKKNKIAIIGLIIIITLAFIALFAPFIAPHDPIEQNLEKRLLPPCREYPMGTDDLGRCLLSRIIYGARVSLQLGVIVVGIITVIGVTLGLISGYYGGIVDEIIMRLVDVVLAFPGIILALAVAGALGPGLFNVMLALAMVGWTGLARVVRGSVLSVKQKEFVESARALGCSDLHIMTRHILPNVMAPVIVLATLDMAFIILAAAGLSFLGLGAQPPTPEWGSMLNNGRAFMRTAPHLTTFPGLAIMVAVLAFNFLGDGLRDALDPRQQRELKE
ncbi:MAG: nickel ABC transporter permease subunit NikC [Methanosarcinales archaeon]|jgi:peptide/nickel transport system permease protein|nr:nickel ABC transporter permease subunit NikC [Methanosarcinales archaeon]